jgi:very-short-patch-repair endonuclease
LQAIRPIVAAIHRLQAGSYMNKMCIGRHIVDFFSPELKLVVEVDGITHDFRAEADAIRDAELRALGIEVLRFGDREVKRDALAVAQMIDEWIIGREEDCGSSDDFLTHPGAARHPSC